MDGGMIGGWLDGQAGLLAGVRKRGGKKWGSWEYCVEEVLGKGIGRSVFVRQTGV